MANWVYPSTETITGATKINEADNKIANAMSNLEDWANSTGIWSGGGASLNVNTIDAQQDTDITGKAEGSFLRYNATSTKYEMESENSVKNIIDASITKTVDGVGTAADTYATLQEAIDFFSHKTKLNDTIVCAINVTASTIAEQIIIDGVDLSFVKLTGTFTADGNAMSTATVTGLSGALFYPFITITNGGVSPDIQAIISHVNVAADSRKGGLFAVYGSKLICTNATVDGSDTYGFVVNKGSYGELIGCTATNNSTGISCIQSSSLYVENCTANSNEAGITALNSSSLHMRGCTASSNTNHGLGVVRGSICSVGYSFTCDSNNVGAYVQEASLLDLRGDNTTTEKISITNSTAYGLYVLSAGMCEITNATISNSSLNDISITHGGHLSLTSANVTYSTTNIGTLNTWSSAGVLFSW